MTENSFQHPASFRDPSGFIFTYKGEIYRHVNTIYQENYEHFIRSGLYEDLVSKKILIPHQEIKENFTGAPSWFTTLKPENVSFISYPYEWSFSMLKDAALLTLQLAITGLDYGLVLKDATPYNVQLHKNKMTFIDTLSFERYQEGDTWIAYRQFCENFLGPLALMHYLQLPLQQLMQAFPAGIPLRYIQKMLPFKSRLNMHLFLHIHLHNSFASKSSTHSKKAFLSKNRLYNLLNGLHATVSSLNFKDYKEAWGDYYEEAGKRPHYLEEKKQIISHWVTLLGDVESVLDIGGNKGEFSMLFSKVTKRIICADGEHYAIDELYLQIKDKEGTNIHPLLNDFTNPSPANGFNSEERLSLFQRASSDLVMALAFIHHLTIAKNIPFDFVAKMFVQLGKTLIIEFVEKDDEKVQLLLKNKKDMYDWYTEDLFIKSFSVYYKIIKRHSFASHKRTLFLMERL